MAVEEDDVYNPAYERFVAFMFEAADLLVEADARGRISFLGGGTETSLASILPVGWFLRSEYRYDYFNTINVPVAGVAAPGLTIGWHPVVQTLTTSLMYKFNWQ